MEDQDKDWLEAVKSFKPIKHNNNHVNTNSNHKKIDFSKIQKHHNADYLMKQTYEKYNSINFKGYFDKKVLKDINSGHIPVEKTLDLHNYTQKQAEEAFINFITNCFNNKIRYVLVVTGKGQNNEGVLYQNFFSWVEDYRVKKFIVEYSKANIKHGGSGAFYLFLRKNNQSD
jgi:DNA-nicking Smr family endonuclease